MEQVNVYSIKCYKISGMFLKPRLNLMSSQILWKIGREPNPTQTESTKICEIRTAKMMSFLGGDTERRVILSRGSLRDHPSQLMLLTLEIKEMLKAALQSHNFGSLP